MANFVSESRSTGSTQLSGAGCTGSVGRSAGGELQPSAKRLRQMGDQRWSQNNGHDEFGLRTSECLPKQVSDTG